MIEKDSETGVAELVSRATTDNLEPFKWPVDYGVLGAVCTGTYDHITFMTNVKRY